MSQSLGSENRDGSETAGNTTGSILGTLLLLGLIFAVLVPVVYFIYTVVIPGIAAGFAQFSTMTGSSYSGPNFR